MSGLLVAVAGAQPPAAQQPAGFVIQGVVYDAAKKPIADAAVLLVQKGSAGAVATKTDAEGAFTFSALHSGAYTLSAERAGARSRATPVTVPSKEERERIDLVLGADAPQHSGAERPSASADKAMEFADQPNFTVAGVTDWTAVGGHGSDASLRTSEALARETLTLKADAPTEPGESTSRDAGGGASGSEDRLRTAVLHNPGSFDANHRLGEYYLHAGRYAESIPLLDVCYKIAPANDGNEYDLALAYQGAGDFSAAREHVRKLAAHRDDADLHRLAGDLDERLGDPLAAVHEYQQAAELDPSERNYFVWGSELLLHRAVWQAREVFQKGSEVFPKSARMLSALGTALFAGALYDQAALRLCEASELNPADRGPYIFMGKIEIAAPSPLACIEPRLARFAQAQPENALASYYYAMAIWKRQGRPPDPVAMQQVETLLEKAVTNDPKCAEAYLQLGILHSNEGDFRKAIGYYSKAIAADPHCGEAHYRLGVAYDRTGEPAKAKGEFKLHDEVENLQAAAIERQRREIKQFLVVLQGPSAKPALQRQ